jgi:transcription termination/antitermination protein NusA
VVSRDRDVDSVGACVGMKGMRVQSIIRELRGEKIDIIEFSEDSVVFATHALSPAKISRVSIVDAVDKHMEVIVDDTQLSLAIGKKGQNVRLAAKLLGWKIDIKSEEEKRQEVETAMAALVPAGAPVSVLIDHSLAEDIVEKLLEAGVATVEKLGSMTPEELEAIPSIGPKIVEKILVAVNSYYAQFESGPEAGDSDAEGGETAVEASPEGELTAEEVAPESAESADPSLEAESAAAAGGSETAETGHVPGTDTRDEKKEFDTIENSEGVR